MDRENQKKTLAFLWDQMEQTNALYESAKEEYERVKAAVNEIDSDRSKKILHSVRVCKFIQQSYKLALNEYTDFLLNCKPPDANSAAALG
jgi:hypothetical protein